MRPQDDTRSQEEISRAKEAESRKAGFRSPPSPAAERAKALHSARRQAAARVRSKASRKARREARK